MLPADPFGRSRLPLDALDRAARVRLLAQARDALAAGEPPPPEAAALLAQGLDRALREGVPLDRALGLRPPRGSRRTAARLARQAERNWLIVRVAEALGGNCAAVVRVIAAEAAPPPEVAPLVRELRRFTLPKSAEAVRRIVRTGASSG